MTSPCLLLHPRLLRSRCLNAFTMQGIYLAGVYPLSYFEEDLRYEFAAQQIYLVRG